MNREISKINYRIHTDAIKEHLIVPELPKQYQSFTYATEADVLNVAMFGMTAKQWREANPNTFLLYALRLGFDIDDIGTVASESITFRPSSPYNL